MPANLYDLTLHEARQLLDSRQVSSRELTQAVLDRVQQVERRLKAFVTVTGEVIDSWCYLTEIMYPLGTAHHQCARRLGHGRLPVGPRRQIPSTGG